MNVCRVCGKYGKFWNDICDENGKKFLFYLCTEHQKEYRELTERFVGGRSA